MLGRFRKQTQDPMSSAGSEDEYNPLDGVRVEGEQLIIESPVNDDEPAFDMEEQQGRVREAVGRLYNDEKFHDHIVRLLGWVGRSKGYQSLQVDHSDEAFRSACDVVYERLANGPAGRLLDRLGDKALEDLIIVTVGFGPVVSGVMAEQRDKKRARLRAVKDKAKGEENER